VSSRLPSWSGRKVVQTFVRLGWRISRQRGSHIILIKAGQIASLCVPDHPTVKRGTLRALIRSAGLTVEEFLAAE
jgi:predicted RNA binding protein YcfA (HicA-like mRNA interferase family)